MKEKIATVDRSHRTGGSKRNMKRNTKAVSKVRARPNIRLGRLTFLERRTPIVMPRMIDDEIGL